MKKVKMVILLILTLSLVTGCTKNKFDTELSLAKIKSICEMATLKTYYHNVAVLEKEAGSGLAHIFEKDREMWVEYTGIAKIGIDMSKLDIDVNGKTIKIILPAAEILSLDIDTDDFSKDSFIYSEDSIINKNEITADDQTQAINNAQENMRKSIEANSQLMTNAQDRAKELITNYINQIGDLAGIEYKIEWSSKN